MNCVVIRPLSCPARYGVNGKDCISGRTAHLDLLLLRIVNLSIQQSQYDMMQIEASCPG